jgi:hypothetical protein
MDAATTQKRGRASRQSSAPPVQDPVMPAAFDLGSSEAVVAELRQKEQNEKEQKATAAGRRRAELEEQYVELLERVGERRPGDVEQIAEVAGELDISPERMEGDLKVVADALDAMTAIARSEIDAEMYQRLSATTPLEIKRLEAEIEDRQFLLYCARGLRLASATKAPQHMLGLAASRPMLFTGHPPKLRGKAVPGMIQAAADRARQETIEAAQQLAQLEASIPELQERFETLTDQLRQSSDARNRRRAELGHALSQAGIANETLRRQGYSPEGSRVLADAQRQVDEFGAQANDEDTRDTAALRDAGQQLARAKGAQRQLMGLRVRAPELFLPTFPVQLRPEFAEST